MSNRRDTVVGYYVESKGTNSIYGPPLVSRYITVEVQGVNTKFIFSPTEDANVAALDPGQVVTLSVEGGEEGMLDYAHQVVPGPTLLKQLRSLAYRVNELEEKLDKLKR